MKKSALGMMSMDYEDVVRELESLSDPEAVKGMARYAIATERAYGVSIPNLRRIAKTIGINHDLAQQLWSTETRETRILASMVDDPAEVSEGQMERWVRDFDSWEVCDQCCSNLFDKTKFAYGKAVEWSARKEEFVKRAGFVLMAALAVHDKAAGNEEFTRFLPIIRREASDSRNFVKKAVNWALRQIGKRNAVLNLRAIETAEKIQALELTSAKWIASDALRELRGDAVQRRLGR